jgi:hypothetical protein
MARIKKITLAALVALALTAGGLAIGGEASQVAGSKGCRPPNESRACRESAFQISFIDDEEIIEQVAGSKGDRARGGRESSIAGSAGGRSRAGRESASLQVTPAELQQVAGSRGSSSTFGRESS